jgi:hypothetical protein
MAMTTRSSIRVNAESTVRWFRGVVQYVFTSMGLALIGNVGLHDFSCRKLAQEKIEALNIGIKSA